MIPVAKLLAHFKRMNAEHWPYEWGAAREGCVDCSGAFVWAYDQEGEDIYHGSNRIAREYVVELLPISQAKPGMAAFKARKPGEDNYALPQGYLAGGGRYNGDVNDYYHIGLVDDDPSYVLNAKSTAEGFRRSPISENWDFVAYLKDVEYGERVEDSVSTANDLAVVYAEDGNPVKLRPRPRTDDPYLAKVPVGAQVEVLDRADGWATVRWNGQRGYMMDKFLRVIGMTPVESEPAPADGYTITLSAGAAAELLAALRKAGVVW